MDREPQKWVPKVMPLIANMRKDPDYYAKYESALRIKDSWKLPCFYEHFDNMKALQKSRITPLQNYYLIIIYNFTKLIELLNPRIKFIFNNMVNMPVKRVIKYATKHYVSIDLFEIKNFPNHGEYYIMARFYGNKSVMPPNGIMDSTARYSYFIYTKRSLEHMLNFYPFERFTEAESEITRLMPGILKIVYDYI